MTAPGLTLKSTYAEICPSIDNGSQAGEGDFQGKTKIDQDQCRSDPVMGPCPVLLQTDPGYR